MIEQPGNDRFTPDDTVTLTVPRDLAHQILSGYDGPKGTPLDTLIDELARVMLMASFDEESQPGGMIATLAPDVAKDLRTYFDRHGRPTGWPAPPMTMPGVEATT